jgi:hypothetical protein
MARFEFGNSPPEMRTEGLRHNWQIAGAQVMVALYRLDALLRKFDPNQPRVPAGSGDSSGEWSRVGGGTTKPRPIQFVLSGQDSDSDSSETYRPVSRALKPKTIAASPDPLTPRKGNGRTAQISSAANDVATGRSASVRKTIGSGLESAEVRIERQSNSKVMIDISPRVGRLQATGTLSSEPGKVTISDLNLTAPGLFNPLRVDSVPKRVSISDAPDGTLRIQADGRLTVSAPLVGNFDLLPGKVLVITD